MSRDERTPEVSVVMPVFNGGAYLVEAVESILKQTLASFELVAVDDGSEDDSAAVLEGLALLDSRVRMIQTDHEGMSSALNRGLAEAQAEYVAVANADDLSVPERLVHQTAFLDAHPRVAVVGGLIQTIDAAGNSGHLLRFPATSRQIRRKLRRHNCLAHPSVMFRRSAVAAVGGYRFEFSEDYDLWLRISERFDLANLQRVLVLYRIHPGQVSFSRLAEMERWRLAVGVAGRFRAAGHPDPLVGVSRMTPALLQRLGIQERTVRRAVRAEWFSRTAALSEFNSGQAEDLIGSAADELGPRTVRTLDAARRLRQAERLLAARRHLPALALVVQAGFRAPGYSSTRVRAWLLDLFDGVVG